MKKTITLLFLFGSFGLSAATCHKYNYELGLLSGWFNDDEYTFSISYCINDDGTLSATSVSEHGDNSYLQEPCATYSRNFNIEKKVELSANKKIASITMNWMYNISNDVKMVYDGIYGKVVFYINNANVGDPTYTSSAKRTSGKDLGIAGEIILLEQEY